MIDRRGEQLTHGFVVEEFFFFFFLLRVSVRGETSPLFFQPCPLSIPTALVAHLRTTFPVFIWLREPPPSRQVPICEGGSSSQNLTLSD